MIRKLFSTYSISKAKMLLATLFILDLCEGCKTKGSEIYQTESTKFAKYLEQTRIHSIPDDSSIYILISTSACYSCVKGVFLQPLNLPRNKQTFVLLPLKLIDRISEVRLNPGSYNEIIDSTDAIDRLPLLHGNISLVKTSSGKIYSMKAYEPFEMAKLQNDLGG